MIVDRELMPLVRAALALARVTPLLIEHDDAEYSGPATGMDALDYEAFLSSGDPEFDWLNRAGFAGGSNA